MNGSGVAYDYEFRIYNARIGKFLSTDPLTKSYPFYTPYQFAGNKPTIAIDIDGLEEWVAIYAHGTDNEPSTFRFAPELKSLGAGQIYKRILDDRNDETNLTVYNVNKQKTVNIAFILNEALVEEDINKHGIAAFSSYSIDASFFKSLKPRTPGVN